SFSPKETSLPSRTEERCVSCAIIVEIGTAIPKPAAPTCVRKRRREVRSASLIIRCATLDIPSPDMQPLPVWYLRNRTFVDMSQQATERARRHLARSVSVASSPLWLLLRALRTKNSQCVAAHRVRYRKRGQLRSDQTF